MRRRLVALCLSCLLATLLPACSGLPAARAGATTSQEAVENSSQPPPAVASNDFRKLADYAEWVNQQPAQVLLPLYQRTQNQVQTGPDSDLERVKLALLLSAPDTPFHNDDLALLYLNQVRQHDRGGALQSFARLQRLWLLRLKHIRQQLQQERQRRASLEHQLQQLKAIETDLGPRSNQQGRLTP